MTRSHPLLRLALLLSLFLATTAPRAETFAGRADVQRFVAEMSERHGFDSRQLLTLFAGTRPIPAVIRAIKPPADPGIRSWHAYRGRFVEPKRIAAGRRFMAQHGAELARAEARYGVPAEIIAAVIGVETIYGKHMGKFQTFAALATLTFDYPPRAELFRRELEELLLLAREEQRDPLSYAGSYAGALGLPQFLPSSRRRYAVDFDGDGRINLATSPADAIGSVAHFLAEHGWQRGGPIALDVRAAGDGVQALLDAGITPQRLPSEMKDMGVASDNAPEEAAALIDLITPNAPTEYRLGYRNFYVITRYNRSSFYAAAVMDLAAALRASE